MPKTQITKLKKNQIFVFGSNLNGFHAGGAAAQAMKWGAILGQGEGLQGKTYAFPTLDKKMHKVSQTALKRSVKALYKVCSENPDKDFLLTKVGCGIAGFTEEEIKPLFTNAPSNLVLPEDWQTKKLWKFLRTGMKSQYGSHVWEIGKWYHEDKVVICGSGFHASDTPLQALGYVSGEILALCEAKGINQIEDDKSVWSDMRITKAYHWKKEDSVALAIFAVEQVIDLYEIGRAHV